MPVTLHTVTVWLANVTGKPEVAVADSVTGVPTVTESGAVKPMVCGNAVTEKLRLTVDAASQ